MQRLTREQIDTTVNNLFRVQGMEHITILRDEDHPRFGAEEVERYNLPKITKFGSRYVLYRGSTSASSSAKDTPASTPTSTSAKKAASIASPKVMFVFVVEADKFDALFLRACIGYWHLISDEVTSLYRPQVYICPAFSMTDKMRQHIPTNIIPCVYRFVTLCELYPRIGSRRTLYGMAYDLRIYTADVDTDVHSSGRSYATILDHDVDVKVLNAMPGEIIAHRRLLQEQSPYGEVYMRQVVSTVKDMTTAQPSGICYGNR